MRNTSTRFGVALALCAALSAPQVFAQKATATEPPAVVDYKGAVLGDIADVGQKLLNLAEAMPADKFKWRPNGDGTPSVSEVFMFAATQYYHLPSEWGLLKAAGYEADGDQVTGNRAPSTPLEKAATDKPQVMNELFDAVSYFNGIAKTLTDSDLQKPLKVAGRNTTTYGSLLTMDGDVHEYLAQAIAYARLNGITVSWMKSREQEQEQRGWRTEVTRVKQTN